MLATGGERRLIPLFFSTMTELLLTLLNRKLHVSLAFSACSL